MEPEPGAEMGGRGVEGRVGLCDRAWGKVFSGAAEWVCCGMAASVKGGAGIWNMCALFVAVFVDGQASVLALWCGLIIALNAMAEIDCWVLWLLEGGAVEVCLVCCHTTHDVLTSPDQIERGVGTTNAHTATCLTLTRSILV